MRRGWEWTLLRCCLATCWLTTLVYVTIPDYGYSYTLFTNLAYDPTGWLHECFYISAFFVSLVTLTYFWQSMSESRQLFKTVVRRIEKDL